MKPLGTLKGVVIVLAVVGLCVPQPLWGAVKAKPSAVIADVELFAGPASPVLIGQICDGQGVPQAKAPVSLHQGKRKLAEGTTDRNGNFAFSGLRGGLYQLATGKGSVAYRVWAPGTAPPSAEPAAQLIVEKDLVRGQSVRNWFANPWVIGTIIAAAVTIPVVLHNVEQDKSP